MFVLFFLGVASHPAEFALQHSWGALISSRGILSPGGWEGLASFQGDHTFSIGGLSPFQGDHTSYRGVSHPSGGLHFL